MDVRVYPTGVDGTVRAPPSKSYTHRAILAAGYAGGGVVRSPLVSADTKATARATRLFGGDVAREDEITVDAPAEWPTTPADVIDCANSGTTMRLTIATAALADGTTVLTGDESLRSRPQGPLLDALEDLGSESAESSRGNGQAPVVVSGPVEGGSVSLPDDIPSQYISALLMAGPKMADGVEIELDSPPKEVPYINLTIELLDSFGVQVADTDGGYAVSPDQSYEREDPYVVPGDFSSISYPLAAGAVAGEVTVSGAQPSAQGDSEIVSIVKDMGADVSWDEENGRISVSSQPLSGIEVDVTDIPDLLPTIAVLGAVADGTTTMTNCAHVRQKETDRVEAMTEALTKMGASVSETEDTMTVHGGETELTGATVEGRSDHRLIMALSIAGLVADGPTTIRGAEHVDVSYPQFFDHLSELGVEVDRL
ncbi:3-phosphoshikimate 1-carboxyvinyltransferase [Natrarchaeobius chitinivorans]|uniref:3-phosphoshikimate 1-carboxyvinyltransferase n=1 Tax=Natrarchaeobius chitinivorans TaxID=1679083 RepID=A0A3N6MW28_NATCH|nr:3-phosphoshikimate 1-carboxyvinyltransferase [Natrarchaeobius chitinivorans]RQG89662.1 3-phosphoshikimate 1-carboxyvinyltransferase [Natrarchaeobius chitinivorans]